MKKIFLKKLLLAFSGLILLVYGTIYACGDGGDYEWGWNFDSNFTPETFVDPSYSPLFLSTDVFYGIVFDQQHNTRFNDEMVLDWSVYLKNSTDNETAKFFLLDSSATDVEQLFTFFSTKKSNATATKWSKKWNLKDNKVKEFITFLHYAQAIEQSSNNNYNNWNYEEEQSNFFTDLKWIKTIENKYNTSTDSFLKNRYWFQTIKAYFYSSDKQLANTFFQKTEKTAPKNTLYYRALAYIAGLEYKEGNYAKSNYLYSQVFDKCPAMRVVAAYCFHPQEQTDWEQSLSMAKNNQEKVALWAIHGYYKDEQTAIEKIAELQPESEHLDFLLTRLINNQESKIDDSFRDKTVAQSKNKTKGSIDKATIALVQKMAQSDKTAQPYLWNVAAGYLETLNGNYTQADKNFDKAESTMPKTPLAIAQVRLLRFVNNLNKINKITSNAEKAILKDLVWLYQELPNQNLENFRYENATQWSKNYLSALYKAQKNIVMTELFASAIDFYENDVNIEKLKQILTKKDKSAFEKLATSVYETKIYEINAYQAVKATYQNKISDAIAFMQQSDSLQKTTFYGNPFNGNIKDCHDCDHAAFQKKKYSQIEFLNTIKVMQDKLLLKEDVYTNSLLLANAFYNITHFGNARIFYESNITGYGSYPYSFRTSSQIMITNCSLAKKYYQEAFAAAKNDEQRAKCQYMLAKCERNEYYNNKYSGFNSPWDIADDKINFLAWSGFKTLKNDYSNTNYYQEVIQECGYFATYTSN